MLSERDAGVLWSDLREFGWAHADGALHKIALAPAAVAPLAAAAAELAGTRIHFSAGGNVVFVSLPDDSLGGAFAEQLQRLGLRGIALRGSGPLWTGQRSWPEIAAAVKSALDPENRFPELDD